MRVPLWLRKFFCYLALHHWEYGHYQGLAKSAHGRYIRTCKRCGRVEMETHAFTGRFAPFVDVVDADGETDAFKAMLEWAKEVEQSKVFVGRWRQMWKPCGIPDDF